MIPVPAFLEHPLPRTLAKAGSLAFADSRRTAALRIRHGRGLYPTIAPPRRSLTITPHALELRDMDFTPSLQTLTLWVGDRPTMQALARAKLPRLRTLIFSHVQTHLLEDLDLEAPALEAEIIPGESTEEARMASAMPKCVEVSHAETRTRIRTATSSVLKKARRRVARNRASAPASRRASRSHAEPLADNARSRADAHSRHRVWSSWNDDEECASDAIVRRS